MPNWEYEGDLNLHHVVQIQAELKVEFEGLKSSVQVTVYFF